MSLILLVGAPAIYYDEYTGGGGGTTIGEGADPTFPTLKTIVVKDGNKTLQSILIDEPYAVKTSITRLIEKPMTFSLVSVGGAAPIAETGRIDTRVSSTICIRVLFTAFSDVIKARLLRYDTSNLVTVSEEIIIHPSPVTGADGKYVSNLVSLPTHGCRKASLVITEGQCLDIHLAGV